MFYLISSEQFEINIMQRQTRQRALLEEILTTSPQALSAQELFELAKERCPGLGLATIYRTINTWVENGEVKAIHLPNSATKYEAVQKGYRHYFQCENCAKTFGLSTCSGNFSKMLPEGFILKAHEVILYGLCSSCA